LYKFSVRVIAEFDMTEFMRNQESLLEGRPNVFVKNESIFGNKGSPSAI
jgi:hypothetical protein